MQREIERIDTIHEYNDYLGVETLHPLITVIELDNCNPLHLKRLNYGLFGILLKTVNCGPMKYGVSNYDYKDGTVVTIAPGQVFGAERKDVVQPKGWALFFHPDLIRATELGRTIRQYTFFGYESNEALHTSARERRILQDCFRNIQSEIEHDIDMHTDSLLVKSIGLLLGYCLRFYDRQFASRHKPNTDVLARFENYLDNYIQSGQAKNKGLPTVAMCADHACLSANYFGDLIKKETGRTAQEYIQLKLIDMAKLKLLGSNMSINEISEVLGFKYATHMTRLFKRIEGISPTHYRQVN